MSTRFKTNAVGFRRRVLVPAIILSSLAAGLVLYNYAASASSLLESVTIKQYSSRSSFAGLLGSSTPAVASASGPLGGSSSSSSSSSVAAGSPARQQLKATMQRPIAEPDAAVVQQRCGATLGDWCGRYEAQEPVPAVAPPTGTKECLWGCNFVGVCDASKGWCRCPAGWTGDDCLTRQKRPCSQRIRDRGLEPFNEPVDPKAGPQTTMACIDLCDEDIGQCFCNSTFRHGRVPADPNLPPGTPPKRRGRPINYLCRRSKPYRWGDVEPELLYGKEGWCEADKPRFECPCILDGHGGPTCDEPVEMFCPNQCNGHGECNRGFCKCHEGWWGHDCAYRNAGTPWTPGLEETERPWLRGLVHTPAARDPAEGATRKRPLIYIYELPPMYNSHMLSYRVGKQDCVHRIFRDDNRTDPNEAWLYGPEMGLHEMLLQSEHRTLDPEEADYFYLPVYAACFIYPILGANDFPFFHSGPVAWRTHAAANMFIEVFHWIRSHHPYWDRNGGRDHIVVSAHDEGSCWVPAVLRPAIILSHWGRTEFPHISGTGYWPDNYSADSRHDVWQPEGHVGKLGDFPCFDPKKDMIIPPFSSPDKHRASPLLGAPTRNRTVLAFFKGRIQPDNPAYSRGTRQFLAKTAEEQDWWGKHRVWIGDGWPPEALGSYSEALASSVFCPALMGDGFSSRFDDGVLHGCIPVIVQDGVEMSWAPILDVGSYSVRVAQKDMARLPEILKAVSPQDVARMQANLAKVWRRHLWSGYRPFGESVRRMLKERRDATAAAPLLSQPPPLTDFDPGEDDVLATLLQWLYSRLADLGAHAPSKPARRA